MRALTHPAHLLSARKNVIKGKIAKNGHFKEIFESFRFFEKKIYHISYFGPLVILSFIIKLSKIRKMHAKLVKIRQCKGFYFGMGLIELSMKNMFLHKYIYRVCYVWKFYDQFFNDILSIIINFFSNMLALTGCFIP